MKPDSSSKADSKTLYYSLLKLEYGPCIWSTKETEININYASLNNSLIKCHKNSTNKIFYKNTFRSLSSDRLIDLCILHVWVACYEFFCFFGDFHALGLQEAGVTKSLQVTDFRTDFKNQVVHEFTSCIFLTRFWWAVQEPCMSVVLKEWSLKNSLKVRLLILLLAWCMCTLFLYSRIFRLPG